MRMRIYQKTFQIFVRSVSSKNSNTIVKSQLNGTHPSLSFSRTSLNKTADSSGMVEYDVNAAVKAIVSEIQRKKDEYQMQER